MINQLKIFWSLKALLIERNQKIFQLKLKHYSII